MLTAAAASTATARKYTGSLPLLVIDRPSLTDLIACAYDLYLQIVRDLSKGNQQKVSAKATAIEWNVRVSQMLSNAEAQGPPEAAEQIRCEFGYIGTKDAQRHADRLDTEGRANAICRINQ